MQIHSTQDGKPILREEKGLNFFKAAKAKSKPIICSKDKTTCALSARKISPGMIHGNITLSNIGYTVDLCKTTILQSCITVATRDYTPRKGNKLGPMKRAD